MELELSEVETQSRRMDNKRKRLEEPSKPEERKRKEKKRKFAKLVNWGETISSQEEEDHHPVGRVGNMEDWVTKQEMEKEERTRDWLFSYTLQPKKRLKQMKMGIPILVKKAGKESEGLRKTKPHDRKRRKFSKKEEEEVRKTSMNIFDWFNEKDKSDSPGASMESASPGTSTEFASPGASMELVVEDAQNKREEKEERLRRMVDRKNSWFDRMMVKELVLELINNTRS